MSEKTVDFCDGTWKIGDSVFHSEYGWTEIENIELIPNRICVKSQWFRADGRSGRMSALPTIFPNKFTVSDEAYDRPVERPDLAMDTPIWIKKGHYWIPKHFAGWTGDRQDQILARRPNIAYGRAFFRINRRVAS